MGFGDKFKDLAKQAQDAVAEHKEQITQAVDRASVAADQRTGGKYSDKIAKVGQKAERAVEKLGGDQGARGEAPAPGSETAGEANEPSAGPVHETPPKPPPGGSAEPPDFG
jgi:hypothetical protein